MVQKKRDKKTSKGEHGAGGKTKLDRLQLALLGKGPTPAVAAKMHRESLRAPGAKPRKAQG